MPLLQETRSTEFGFFMELQKCLPKSQNLKQLLSPDRYYKVQCPPGVLSRQQENMIQKVRECVIRTAQNLPHWGEEIPQFWANFEDVLKEKKEKRILERRELVDLEKLKYIGALDIDDMLQFFHEIGQIIYFADKKLKDVIIIDVQWFVDGFKTIITDPQHLAREIPDCDQMIQSGRITEETLRRIWSKEKEKPYIQHMNAILPYMEKLGLMVEIEPRKEQSIDGKEFYIPSMNKNDISPEDVILGEKTPILIFHFKTYLPHFFFFRLVVLCFREWGAFDQEKFGKNIAFYKEKDFSHCIAIAVSKTSIQLQVFTPRKKMSLLPQRVIAIREKIEGIVDGITETFHRKVLYEIGYPCKNIQIKSEDEDSFLSEDEVLALKNIPSGQPCPKHVGSSNLHDIDTEEMLQFWRRNMKSS